MTPRRRALGVRLTLCNGECSSDAVLCAIHQAIEAAIVDALNFAEVHRRSLLCPGSRGEIHNMGPHNCPDFDGRLCAHP